MNDSSIYVIIVLMPLTALLLTVQVNPYHALVIRGILGAVAVLVYVVLGAADVALTEALVGTMLAITLYAVAVRSSLVMRIGVLKDGSPDAENRIKESRINSETGNDTDYPPTSQHPFAQLIADLRTIASKYHLRLELIPYADPRSLHQALMEKEVHITCISRSHQQDQNAQASGDELQLYQTTTRICRLHEILQSELSLPTTSLTYITEPDAREKH